MVEIDEEHADQPVMTHGSSNRVFNPFLKERPVRQMGQVIVMRHEFQAFFVAFVLRDIRKHGDIVGTDTGFVVNRADGHQDRVFVATFAGQPHLTLPMTDVRDAFRDGADQLWIVRIGHQIKWACSSDFCLVITRDIGERLVHRYDSHTQVCDGQGLREAFHGFCREAQSFFSLTQLGDIRRDTGHALAFAAHHNGDKRAFDVAMNPISTNPTGDEVAHFPVQCIAKGLPDFGILLGVDQRVER